MKAQFIILLMVIFAITVQNSFAQYQASGGLLTTNTGSSGSGGNSSYHHQDNSVGALGPKITDNNNRSINYYAISNQYSSSTGNHCWRKIRFFKDEGTLLATSAPYSHDHTGVTKIIFDPNDGKVVYALYQERKDPNVYPSPFYTYIKRFEFNPANNTITASPRYEIFNFTNSTDFVIAANSDLLIGSVYNDGSVKVKTVRLITPPFFSTPIPTVISTLQTSAPGEATSSNNSTWWLAMDNKDNTIVIAHNKGFHFNRSIKIKKGLYVPSNATLPLIQEYNYAGQSLHRANSISGRHLVQSLALRSNGDICYLMNESINQNWKLIKIDSDDHSTSTLMSGSGDAHLVISENKMIFLAREINNTYKLEKFSEYDAHEHTYNMAWQINTGIKNLTIRDCKVLSCGKYNTYQQYHELYNCSDCNGGQPTVDAQMVNQEFNTTTNSPYGPVPTAVYCRWSDVMIDASASTCEQDVYLGLIEIDPTTWTTQSSLFGGWICHNCTAAHNIKPNDYVTPSAGYNSPSKYYLATIVVGPGWHPTYKLFKFTYCRHPNNNQHSKRNTKNLVSTIFPNPTTDVVNIKIEDIEQQSEITVFNTFGQVVLETTSQGNEMLEIDLSSYNSGVYMIQVINGDQKHIEKVIKQ